MRRAGFYEPTGDTDAESQAVHGRRGGSAQHECELRRRIFLRPTCCTVRCCCASCREAATRPRAAREPVPAGLRYWPLLPVVCHCCRDFVYVAAQTAGTLVYQAQDDPWCNTILLQLQTAIVLDLLAIPAGIGTSFGLDLTSGSELKSRYVVVDHESREGMTEAFDLEFVSATALGDLYRNVGRSCTD